MDSFQRFLKKKNVKLLFSLGFKVGAASIFAAVLSELVQGLMVLPQCWSDRAVLTVGIFYPITSTELLFGPKK